ncbi:hypothetical protein OO306_11920, partial [Pseudomonas sp. DCB_AW]|nr:hypothetical protein [Pseudomonas sp. DCB_AW]
NDYVISRMVTCDADNLCDYQSVLTSTHTNCLIQFVKERLVKSFSSKPRRAFYAFLICCQAFILKFLTSLSFESFQLQQLAACPEAFIAARRRIIRALKSESTP